MSDKDQVFWDALMEKNKSGSEKKIFRKFKKHSKVIDSKHLAEVFNVDKKEIEQIYALFLKIDDDRSGGITAPEIAQGLSSFGCDVSPKVVQAVMRASDKNGDGEINFEEFLAVVISKAKLKKHKDNMQNVIKKLEARNEQYLTADSLRDAWAQSIGVNINEHEANALLAQADQSNEGLVTHQHFHRMWQNVS
uniref:EF-hand domain-containing protein n=2 Tax=Ascaris TaxID=6251 RepID=A0A9J2PYB5_ASCLU